MPQLTSQNPGCCLNYIMHQLDLLKFRKNDYVFSARIKTPQIYFLNSYTITGEEHYNEIFNTILRLTHYTLEHIKKLEDGKKIIIHARALGLGAYKKDNHEYKKYIEAVATEIDKYNNIEIYFYKNEEIQKTLENKFKKRIFYQKGSIFDLDNYSDQNHVYHVILNAGNQKGVIGNGGLY